MSSGLDVPTGDLGELVELETYGGHESSQAPVRLWVPSGGSPIGIQGTPIVQGRLSGGVKGGAAGGWRAACPTPYGSLGCGMHDLMFVLECNTDTAPWGCIILLLDRRVQPAPPDEGGGWQGGMTSLLPASGCFGGHHWC